MRLICERFIRNAAYHRAIGGIDIKPDSSELLKITHANFLDIAILEWAKLFCDPRGQHHWRTVVNEGDLFFHELLSHLSLSEPEFKAYLQVVKRYRDKFLAHLDADEVMQIPKLEIAIDCTVLLSEHLECTPDFRGRAPQAGSDLPTLYSIAYKEGQAAVEEISRKTTLSTTLSSQRNW